MTPAQEAFLAEIENPRAFVLHALDDELRWRGATLDPDRKEDCVSYLSVVLCSLPLRYDPDRGLSFSTYSYRTLRRRYTDWLRKTRGDSRYGNDGREVSVADPMEMHEAVGVRDAQDFESLIDQLDHEKLSTRARGALRQIAWLMVEEGLTAAEAAARLGKSRREANSDLARLRMELDAA